MLNLLKADFLKLKKDKTLKISFIILSIFAIMNAGSYLILKLVGNESELSEMGSMIGTFDGKGVFLSGFNIANNVGLIIPIILCLFVCKEFTYGTIRNKLMIGKSRIQVYLSNLIIVNFIGIVLVTFYMLLSLLLGSLLLGYGQAITGTEILNILATLLIGILIYAVIFSLVTFLCFVTKSLPMSIIFSIVILLILSVIILILTGKNNTIDNVLSYTFISQSMYIITNKITLNFSLKVILSTVVTSSLLTTLGLYLFKNSDLK